MPHPFEIREEIEVTATPEQVWEAVATGPGIDSWFMGRTEVEPGVGGSARMTLMGFTSEATVTAWEPGRHFAYNSEGPDGTSMAFDYRIESRDSGRTVVRLVHSGFLGDDWEAEYDALRKGDPVYLLKLAAYLAGFPNRVAECSVFTPGPQVADAGLLWAALGVGDPAGPDPVTAGTRVRLAVDGLDAEEGEVVFAHAPNAVGVRVGDALCTFSHGHQGMVVIEHHDFAKDAEEERIARAWQSWLDRSFA
ncbi:SRPBCC domain-containing protein [Microbispora sp. RL4-1S]|uniref:SRPBCC domain-containing protein n=1 Tax=Microbispora oryzae TaxID=2806554 RepID=A0A941AM43_9ACTN|nr:SRPBCC domain-containing protein [Microbispora oryzae]MBP2707967.1 SRPBCC domain-containing protein [Microbispora oryzae]